MTQDLRGLPNLAGPFYLTMENTSAAVSNRPNGGIK